MEVVFFKLTLKYWKENRGESYNLNGTYLFSCVFDPRRYDIFDE